MSSRTQDPSPRAGCCDSSLSPVFQSLYGVDKADIYHSLLIKEIKQLTRSKLPRDIILRDKLVSFVVQSCDAYALHTTTKHLAVQLIDGFFDDYLLEGRPPILLAVGCILIAAKYEEKEIDIPRPRDLVRLADCCYPDSVCMRVELRILKYFNWSIGLVTVAHISELLETECVDATDTVDGNSVSPSLAAQARTLYREYLLFFLHHILKEWKYKALRPSLLAAALMAVIRSKMHLMPIWPDRLSDFTGYSASHITDVADLLLSDYDCQLELQSNVSSGGRCLDCAVDNNSSGYESRTPSPVTRKLSINA